MNIDLFLDMYYAAPELWYIILGVSLLLVVITAIIGAKNFYLRKENYLLKRLSQRYEETLYTSKDGYFAFVYMDDKSTQGGVVEYCSKRLAVLLNLPQGINSSISHVLKTFYKDDVEKILKYITLLCDDGVSFEDVFVIKTGKRLKLSGARVNDSDGNIYGDIVWFRDVSDAAQYITNLRKENEQAQASLYMLESLIDNLPYPAWIRNSNLELDYVNKKYLELIKISNRDVAISQNIELCDNTNFKEFAAQAKNSNKQQKKVINIDANGSRNCYELIETPFLAENSLDKIATSGALIDISDLDNLKRNLKQAQTAHLEILSSLDTAIAVFNGQYKLEFYNSAFAKLWRLDESWLDTNPSYGSFLDLLREKRLAPEVSDYLHYKSDEQEEFNFIIEPKEDFIHLPDNRSLRRLRAPFPKGGLVFAFEDISKHLSARREYNSLVAIQQEMLDVLQAGVIIFSADRKVKFYNKSYVDLWDADEVMLQKEPTILNLLDTYKKFFANENDWQELKNSIYNHILSNPQSSFELNRGDGKNIEVTSSTLSNDFIMLKMRII